jgi:hypothetical protein
MHCSAVQDAWCSSDVQDMRWGLMLLLVLVLQLQQDLFTKASAAKAFGEHFHKQSI